MDREVAKNLVREVLQNPFKKEKFIYLLKNILKRYDESKAFHARGYVKEKFKSLTQVVKTYERVGTYTDLQDKKVDLLIVYLQKENSLERARTTLRNFVADYLKQRDMKDAALVAFVSPDKDNWRFSFVKMQYKFDEQGKVKEEFTPARRYSFLVGKNEKSHTAQSRLLPLLLDDYHKPTLEEIEEAFKVEPVTKEFFQKYRELFLQLKESLDAIIKKDFRIQADFQKKNINSVDFAKKLLGQIVFLYFLQKKGWFGVEKNKDWGTGDKNFLRSLFEKKIVNNENFFNDVLEPLFYEALRTKRPVDYYSRFDCKIPFLNGGLFDPIGDYDWQNTYILLPNHLFSNNQKTKEGDIGDGILDIFDRYNFTVKEDEPLEKEVAIDPEMLGKVFENLLEVKDRKSKGTYYTPREIVHYMCQESLINYLATELTGKVNRKDIEILIKYGENVVEHDSTVAQKGQETTRYSFKLPKSVRENAKLIDDILASVKICDPAVGSGAFLVSMMNEIVKARMTLTPYIGESKTRIPYYFKRHAIQNCLYGVDIDPGAIEICKLRLWLSLVVDEEDIKNIKPLPNLDYKIMQGDSLVSGFMGIDFDQEIENKNSSLGMLKDKMVELIEELKRKKDEYQNEASVNEKQKLRQEIENLIIKIFETKLSKQKSEYFNKLNLIEEKYKVLPNKDQRELIIKKEKEKLYKEFGFNLDQFEKQLREYTTGNKIRPFFPWKLYFAEVFQEKGGFDIILANPPYIQLQKDGGKLANLYQDKNFETFDRMGDIYTLFYERGINLLKNNGILTFISSNKWMRAGYGKKLRKFFLKYNPLILIDLGPNVFETATVDTNILIVQKSTNQNRLLAVTYKDKKLSIEEALKTKGVILENLSDNAWFIGSREEIALKQKIERIGKPLKDWDVRIFYGIKTGLNKAFIIDTETRNKILANCKTEEERKRTEEIIKPILRGRDIKRYYYEWAGLWVIGTFPALHLNIDDYPAIKKYFLDNFDIRQLEQSGKKYPELGFNARKKTENKWFETQDQIAYYQEFEKEKVVWQEIVRKPSFAYDTKNFYCEATSFLMTGKNLKYLLAILNSKPAAFFFKEFYAGGGLGEEGYRYKKAFLEQLPIPKIPKSAQKPFIDLVDKILDIKSKDPDADTSNLEHQINRLVYKLYNLTEEEIQIIENYG